MATSTMYELFHGLWRTGDGLWVSISRAGWGCEAFQERVRDDGSRIRCDISHRVQGLESLPGFALLNAHTYVGELSDVMQALRAMRLELRDARHEDGSPFPEVLAFLRNPASRASEFPMTDFPAFRACLWYELAFVSLSGPS